VRARACVCTCVCVCVCLCMCVVCVCVCGVGVTAGIAEPGAAASPTTPRSPAQTLTQAARQSTRMVTSSVDASHICGTDGDQHEFNTRGQADMCAPVTPVGSEINRVINRQFITGSNTPLVTGSNNYGARLDLYRWWCTRTRTLTRKRIPTRTCSHTRTRAHARTRTRTRSHASTRTHTRSHTRRRTHTHTHTRTRPRTRNRKHTPTHAGTRPQTRAGNGARAHTRTRSRAHPHDHAHAHAHSHAHARARAQARTPAHRSPVHPLTLSPAHLLTCSPAHPLTRSPAHPLTRSPTLLTICPSAHLPTRPPRRKTPGLLSPNDRMTSRRAGL